MSVLFLNLTFFPPSSLLLRCPRFASSSWTPTVKKHTSFFTPPQKKKTKKRETRSSDVQTPAFISTSPQRCRTGERRAARHFAGMTPSPLARERRGEGEGRVRGAGRAEARGAAAPVNKPNKLPLVVRGTSSNLVCVWHVSAFHAAM